MQIDGNVYRLADPLFDDVNTDDILPGQYLRVPEEELGTYAFAGRLDNFRSMFQGHSVLVAGRNFGCGSSREQAPKALIRCGIRLVTALSFGYIFYRNAFNLGLGLLQIEDRRQLNKLVMGKTVSVDLASGSIRLADGDIITGTPLKSICLELLKAGGLLNMLKRNHS